MRKSLPTILIAEDSDIDVMMLRRAFKDAALAAPLQFVSDGEEALAYLAGIGKYADRLKYPLPDLFLLDLKMPRKNGFEVLQWLRKQPGLQCLPTIVLTTSEAIRDVNRAYELGANSFLTKPLKFAEFKDTVHAMLNYWTTLNHAPTIQPLPPRANPLLSAPDEESREADLDIFQSNTGAGRRRSGSSRRT